MELDLRPPICCRPSIVHDSRAESIRPVVQRNATSYLHGYARGAQKWIHLLDAVHHCSAVRQIESMFSATLNGGGTDWLENVPRSWLNVAHSLSRTTRDSRARCALSVRS